MTSLPIHHGQLELHNFRNINSGVGNLCRDLISLTTGGKIALLDLTIATSDLDQTVTRKLRSENGRGEGEVERVYYRSCVVQRRSRRESGGAVGGARGALLCGGCGKFPLAHVGINGMSVASYSKSKRCVLRLEA
ncbi:hypothetical protein Tco_0964834 [Tanacetum coccineum]